MEAVWPSTSAWTVQQGCCHVTTGLGGDSAFGKSDLGMHKLTSHHQSSCSFHRFTRPPSPTRCERGNVRHLDGEAGRPLWAGVCLKSYPVRDQLSPQEGAAEIKTLGTQNSPPVQLLWSREISHTPEDGGREGEDDTFDTADCHTHFKGWDSGTKAAKGHLV